MHCIVLYGPPASGKLTIAKKVAALLGYRLLHNHVVSDFAHALYEYGTDEYVAFSKEARFFLIDSAISHGVAGCVMTFAYGVESKTLSDETAILEELQQKIIHSGGSMLFVRLDCPRQILIDRVQQEDRTEFQKLTDPQILQAILDSRPMTEEVPFTTSLVIHTDRVQPEDAAHLIQTEFQKHVS